MYKILLLGMNYVYKACNPTILNLCVDKKKINLGLLDYRPKLLISIILGFVICMCIFLLVVRIFLLLCVLHSNSGSSDVEPVA